MTAEKLSDLITLAVALHGLAVVIVNITPTPKDDEALGNLEVLGVKLYRALEILAGIVTHRAKQ